MLELRENTYYGKYLRVPAANPTRNSLSDPPISMNTKIRRLLLSFVITGLVLFFIGGYLVLNIRPDVGATAASSLRQVIGNQGVAQLESAVFTLQDATIRQANKLGLLEAKAPWQSAAGQESLAALPQTPTPRLTASATIPSLDMITPTLEPTDAPATVPAATPVTPTATPEPTPSSTPAGWTLPDIKPFGSLAGEGLWQSYITHPDGDVVGLRTFLQPDPERPHTIVAVVAFDLDRVNLNYVLGSEEPSMPGGPRGSGRIPSDDKEPGKLLATFNGGFLATHGQYGAMSDGIVALPPKNLAGTVAMGNDGRVQIGIWGEDIDPAGDYDAWRQNASMVVHQGEINERVNNSSIVTWGGSLDGAIVTWRSGLGLSADGQVLYFLAGPAVSMPILAKTMMVVGAHNGILLDVNPFWVHFAAIRADGDALHAEPLFEEGMETKPDRYLFQSQRDFFYITASES